MNTLFLSSLIISTSWASGENADIELLHLNISKGSIPGIDSTEINDFGQLYLSSQLQYIRDPLVLYADNSDRGSIVGEKGTLVLGAGFDFSDRVSIQARLPIAVQWGSENPTFTRMGVGTGDFRISGRIRTFERPWIKTAAKVDMFLPTGTKNAWLSELQVRANVGLLAQTKWKDVDVLSEVSFLVRDPVNTDRDFVLGNEMITNLGFCWNLWPDQFALGSTVLARFGWVNFLRGGAENSSELINFMKVRYNDAIVYEVGVGKGISSGYGTAEIRGFLNVHFQRKGKKPEPVYPVEPEDIIPEPEIIVPPEEPIPPEEPVFEEEELAKVQDDQIYIRDAIQFQVGTDSILPFSKPTLDSVAKIINDDIKIGHLVIEGHASEEGEYKYNYDLSNLRARAIYKALVDSGVHPDRMSYRGFGEALPKFEGTDEESLAKNRRVEFHIVRQDPAYGPLPILRDIKKSPWTGTPINPVIPELKEKPPEPKKEDVDPFDPEENDIFDDDLDFDFEDTPQKEESDTPQKEESDTPQKEESDTPQKEENKEPLPEPKKEDEQ